MRCYLDSIRMTSVYLCMCLQSVHICVCTLIRQDTDCSRSLQKRQNSVAYTQQTFAFLSCEGLKKSSLPGRWTHTRQGLLSSCSAVFEAFILWSQGATPVPTTVSSGEQERRKTCFFYGQNLELAGITFAHSIWPDLSTIHSSNQQGSLGNRVPSENELACKMGRQNMYWRKQAIATKVCNINYSASLTADVRLYQYLKTHLCYTAIGIYKSPVLDIPENYFLRQREMSGVLSQEKLCRRNYYLRSEIC